MDVIVSRGAECQTFRYTKMSNGSASTPSSGSETIRSMSPSRASILSAPAPPSKKSSPRPPTSLSLPSLPKRNRFRRRLRGSRLPRRPKACRFPHCRRVDRYRLGQDEVIPLRRRDDVVERRHGNRLGENFFAGTGDDDDLSAAVEPRGGLGNV